MLKFSLYTIFLTSIALSEVLALDPAPSACPAVGADEATQVSLEQIKSLYSVENDDKKIPANIASKSVEVETWLGDSIKKDINKITQMRRDTPSPVAYRGDIYCRYTLNVDSNEKGGTSIYYKAK